MDLTKLELKSFLKENRINESDWAAADIDFETLVGIAKDYQQNHENLTEAADFLAKMLQKCKQVHSVRWRVKDPQHLMEKIIRKRIDKHNEKYRSISVDNYMDIITDLVGVRVLHLFKYEWSDIHDYIIKTWEPIEQPIAYVRSGDVEVEVDESDYNQRCNVKEHPKGYRSIHYVIMTQPTLKKIFSEIQVRTIFEEGWSEIDHKIRYPNFTDNKLISYFLTIFNRMAGSADEMGTFVKALSEEISQHQIQLEDINSESVIEIQKIKKEQEEHLSKIDSLIEELSNEKQQSQKKDTSLKALKDEIKKLKNNSTLYSDVTSSATSKINEIMKRSSQMDVFDGQASLAAALERLNLLENNTIDIKPLNRIRLELANRQQYNGLIGAVSIKSTKEILKDNAKIQNEIKFDSNDDK